MFQSKYPPIEQEQITIRYIVNGFGSHPQLRDTTRDIRVTGLQNNREWSAHVAHRDSQKTWFPETVDEIIRELGSEQFCQNFRTEMSLLLYGEIKNICYKVFLRILQQIGVSYRYVNVEHSL